MNKDIVYFDNAATSFPKPENVIKAVVNYMTKIGANPGRSGHKSAIEASEIIFDVRNEISEIFALKNPMKVILCSNATEALNLAISGICKKGDHIITSAMEHNSTIRPLHFLEKNGVISLTIAESDKFGRIDLESIKKHIKKNTKAVVINHASNVSGVVQDIENIAKICKQNKLIFIVDCAQTAGIIPIDINRIGIDILAFAGHKSFYGPTGTGGMAISDNFDYKKIKPLKFGGTGSLSDSIEQPDFLPDIFESGTLNVAGFAGLLEGIKYIKNYPDGINGIHKYKKELANYFVYKAIKEVENFVSYTDMSLCNSGVVAFNIIDKSVSKVAFILSNDYNIMCRSGLHCAPLAHKKFGTYPDGALRFGFSLFNTKSEVDYAVKALKIISEM